MGSFLLVMFAGQTLGAEMKRVSLQLKWHHQFQFAGYYAAQSQGYYKAEGLEVEILEGGVSRPPLPAVLNGVTEFGVGDSSVVLARLQGQPVVVCAAIFQHSPYVFLSREDSGIRTPSDLVGKRVMVSDDQGAAELRAMLKLEGIPMELVLLQKHTWNLEDLIEKRVDAMSAYEMVEQHYLRARDVEPSMLRTLDYGVDFYGDTLFTTESVVERDRPMVDAFVRASLKGWEYAMSHQAEVVDLIMGMDGVAQRGMRREMLLKQAAGMRQYVLPELVEVGHVNLGRWRRIAKVFVEQGFAPSEVDLTGFVLSELPMGDSWGARHWLLLALGGLGMGLLAFAWNLQMRRVVREKTLELRLEISERTRVEVGLRKALEESQRLRAALDQVPACVFIKDNSFRYVYGNRRTLEVVGRSAEELVGMQDSQLFSAESASLIRELDARVLRGEDSAREVEVNHKGGKRAVYWEIKTPIRSGAGINGLLGISTDISERRAAEDRFRTLFDMAPIPMGIYNREGKITLLNQRFVELFGYTLEDLPDLDAWWLKVFPDEPYRQETKARWEEALRAALERGGVVNPVESRVRSKSGKTFPMEAIARPMGEEFLVMLVDLSHRREAEDALRREKEFTRSLLENLDAAVAACDSEGRITFQNRTAREWHGHSGEDSSVEEVSAQFQLFMEDGHTPLSPEMDPLPLALKGKNSRGFRMVIAAPDRPLRHVVVNASCVLRENGERGGAVVVMLDVTDRHNAEASLELQSAALNAAANAIVITDAEGHVLWANEAFTQLSGYTRADVVGQNPRILESGLQKPEFYEELWNTIKRGEVWRSELSNKRKDGSVYLEEMTITPVRVNSRSITHYIAIKQDITERRALEKQYLRSQRMEGVGMLAGGIAHDLNNVLAPILMSVELLRDADLPPKLKPVIESIERSSKRGADIIKQVLTFARGSEGHKGPVQLRHLVKEMIRMASETFPRDIQLLNQLPADLWPIHADATQMHQVLLNLSVNARDAMPKGGKLVYSASNQRHEPRGTGPLAELKAGPYVRLEVSDTGEGISPEHLEHMFEPFFTTKEIGKGTGLGLATIAGIVRGHRGVVEVRSELGKGTVFSVMLPALPDEVAQASPAPAPAKQRGNNELILVVDDEVGILTVTSAILKRAGYRVVTGGNGGQGLEVFDKHKDEVALVITDIMMPIMDGPTMIRHLRERSPNIKCVATSGLMGDADRMRMEDLRAAGVRHFLTKPFSVDQLLTVVREELGT